MYYFPLIFDLKESDLIMFKSIIGPNWIAYVFNVDMNIVGNLHDNSVTHMMITLTVYKTFILQ